MHAQDHARRDAIEGRTDAWNAKVRGLIYDRNPSGAAVLALVLDHAQETGWDPYVAGDFVADLAEADLDGNRTFIERLMREGCESDEGLCDAYSEGRISTDEMLSLPWDYKLAMRDPRTGKDHWEFGTERDPRGERHQTQEAVDGLLSWVRRQK